MSVRGRFITLEGVDGAGKSTHVHWLVEYLRECGINVVSTREPGGTALGEQLRDILLTQPMHLKTETLLMFAARHEHIDKVIAPALAAGQWVVCDRFTDASFAYQGGGRGLSSQAIAQLEQWVHPELQPDLTFLFDVPIETARARLADSREPDRFEREGAQFFERTRAAYHERAAAFPGRIYIVDSTQAMDTVRRTLRTKVAGLVAVRDAGAGQA